MTMVNLSLSSLGSSSCFILSPIIVAHLAPVAISADYCSFSHHFGSAFVLSGCLSASIDHSSFSSFLSVPLKVESSYNFTTITSRQSISSSYNFSFDIFYKISSSSQGGALYVSSTSAQVNVISCKFLNCSSSYSGSSAGGLSIEQASVFNMSCTLFDCCYSSVGDTNSFHVNSNDYVSKCTLDSISTTNGGLLGTGGSECLFGGTTFLSVTNINVSSSSCASHCTFVQVKPTLEGTKTGHFCQNMGSSGGFQVSAEYLTTNIEFDYMNFVNNTSSGGYIFYSSCTGFTLNFSSCIFIYASSLALTSFSYSSSTHVSFLGCGFSFAPTSAQISGETVSSAYSVGVNAWKGQTPFFSRGCFLCVSTNSFTAGNTIAMSLSMNVICAISVIAFE